MSEPWENVIKAAVEFCESVDVAFAAQTAASTLASNAESKVQQMLVRGVAEAKMCEAQLALMAACKELSE